jgi:copper chaperone CopZ
MQTTSINVNGMSCGGCASKVTLAVRKLEGVRRVNVDLDTGAVTITGEQVDLTSVKSAVEQAGFHIAA